MKKKILIAAVISLFLVLLSLIGLSYEQDLTSISSYLGQDWIWLDNMAKNETNVTKVVSDGLVGYWKLNENADDSVGSNDGVISGAINSTNRFGDSNHSLDFDGADDFINISDSASITDIFAGSGSVSAWINIDSAGEGDNGRIVQKGDTSGWIFYLGDTAAPRDLLFLHDFSDGVAYWQADEVFATDGVWYHVAVTYDKDSTSNDPILYVNGVSKTLIEQAAPSGTAESDSGANLYIGNRAGKDKSFEGDIDNLRLYNRSLSAEEIKALYQERNDNHTNGSVSYAFCIDDCINETGLVSQWKLNKSAVDVYGRNDGTITGGVTNKTDCRYGDCFELDGVDGFINVSNDSSIEPVDEVTISLWAYLDISSNDGTLSGLAVRGSGNTAFGGYSLFYDDREGGAGQDEALKFLVMQDTDDYVSITYDSAISQSGWYNIVGTFTNSTGTGILYVNSVQKGTATDTGLVGIFYNSSLDLHIGAGQTTAGGVERYFNGSIDNVMLWNRTLTEEEIYKLYLSGYEEYIADTTYLNNITYDGDVDGSCYFFNSTNAPYTNYTASSGYNYSNWTGYYSNDTSISLTSYSSGATIDSIADYGICELAGSYFTYANFSFSGATTAATTAAVSALYLYGDTQLRLYGSNRLYFY